MSTTSILMHEIFFDAARNCSTEVQNRDLETLSQRLRCEGLSFLTITLPNFLDSFMQAIKEGRVTSNHFVGWKKRLCLPAFMQGFTKLVFCAKTGDLRDDASIDAIHSIRQICSAFKKVKLDCTESRKLDAYDQFCLIDDEIGDFFTKISDKDLQKFEETSRLLWGIVFGKEITDELIGYHGPGSTAEALTGNAKYEAGKFSWPLRIDDDFNHSQYLFGNEENHFISGGQINLLNQSNEEPVRITSVPKTLKKPRIIALEPAAMQFAQQPVKDLIVNQLETHPLTSGHINFRDQNINRELARKASETGEYATLDLSAASDRVHRELVFMMLSVNPQLRNLVFKTRSTKAKLAYPNEVKFVELNKFASMGSALCFPIEAMFFFTVLTMARLEHNKLPLSPRTVKGVAKEIYVYGDDIIIPTNEVETAITYLHLYGNKVGLDKSFWTSKFRESCGMDAYNGRDITPIYIRRTLPSSQRDSQSIVSTIAAANLFYSKGYTRTARYLQKNVEEAVGQLLPSVSKTSGGLGWHFLSCKTKTRFNAKLQRIEVRTLVPEVVYENYTLKDYNALAKCLLKLSRGPQTRTEYASWEEERKFFDLACQSDNRHLERSPRYGALKLKRRWTTP